MRNAKKTKTDTTTYDKLKRAILNNWLFAVLMVAGVGLINGSKVIQAWYDVVNALIPKVTMLVTVNEGQFCNYVFLDGTKLVQRSTLDIGINNNSNRDIMLTSVKLEPDWLTGDFFAGELNPTKQYDINVDGWLKMVKVAQGYLEAKEYDKDSLIRQGRAKEETNAFGSTWWVKPDPAEITGIPGNKYTIKKQSAERFLIHMGLSRSIDFLMGKIYLKVETDSGEHLKSELLNISICEPQAR
jgi:hypothetical protein